MEAEVATSRQAGSRVRVFSGIKPSGRLQLGNYLGALTHFVAEQHAAESFYCVVDLHALTVEQDPGALRSLTVETARLFLACGLDPEVCTLFVQSHVGAHGELAWLMQCTVRFGELRRMVQFKDKEASGQETVRAGLFTYPALMAADILLYDTDRVPVGDDQRQHLELTRDLAERFNATFGETFVVPVATTPPLAARVMDLQNPLVKMGKSNKAPQGVIYLLDSAEVITKKVRRAVTDLESEVRFDPETKPGVSNLLTILAATTGQSVDAVASGYSQYGPLKADTAEAVIDRLRPIRERYEELSSDAGVTESILRTGAARAADVAGVTLARAQQAMGLLVRR